MSFKSLRKLPLIVCLGSLFIAGCNLNDGLADNSATKPLPRPTSINNANTKSYYESLAFTKSQVITRGSSFNNFEYNAKRLAFNDSQAIANIDSYYQLANQANQQNFTDSLSYNSAELMNITYQQNRNTLFILGLGLPLLGKNILQTQENHDGSFTLSAQAKDLGPNNFTGKGIKVSIVDGVMEEKHPDFAKKPIAIPYAAEINGARPLGEDANHGTYVGLIIGGKRGMNQPGLVPDVDFSYLSMHAGDRDLVTIYNKVNQKQPDVINNSYHIPYAKPQNVATARSYEPTIINSLGINLLDETIYKNTFQALEGISKQDKTPPVFVYATGNYNFKDYLRKIVEVESRKKLFDNNYGFETGKDTTLKNLFDSEVIAENLIGVTGLFLDLHGTLRDTIDLMKNNVINGFTAENESDVIARRNAGRTQPVVQFNKNMIISYPGAIQCGVIKYNCIAGSYIYEYANQWQTPTVENSIIKGGTSFSTPEISAIIAMVKEQFPWMNNRNLKQTIYTTSMDVGEPGIDNVFGWGAVNATLALNGPAMFVYGDFVADMSNSDRRPFALREQLDFNINAYKSLPLSFERITRSETTATSDATGTTGTSAIPEDSSTTTSGTAADAATATTAGNTPSANTPATNSTTGDNTPDTTPSTDAINSHTNAPNSNTSTGNTNPGTNSSSNTNTENNIANNSDTSSQSTGTNSPNSNSATNSNSVNNNPAQAQAYNNGDAESDEAVTTVPVSIDDEPINNPTTRSTPTDTPNNGLVQSIDNSSAYLAQTSISLASDATLHLGATTSSIELAGFSSTNGLDYAVGNGDSSISNTVANGTNTTYLATITSLSQSSSSKSNTSKQVTATSQASTASQTSTTSQTTATSPATANTKVSASSNANSTNAVTTDNTTSSASADSATAVTSYTPEQLRQLLSDCLAREEAKANLHQSLSDIGSEAMAAQAQANPKTKGEVADPCSKYRNLVVDVVEPAPLVELPTTTIDPFATKQSRQQQWQNVVTLPRPAEDSNSTTILNQELKQEVAKANSLVGDKSQSKLELIGNKALNYVNLDDPNHIGFNYFFNNNIVGNGGLIVKGSSKDFLYVTGNNSYTGKTIVESANLALVSPQTIGVRAHHQQAVITSPVYVQSAGSYYQHNATSGAVTNNGYTLLSNAIVKGNFRNNPNATLALDVTQTSQIQGVAYLSGTLYLYNSGDYISTSEAKDPNNGTLLMTATGGFIGKFDKVFLDNEEITDYQIFSNGTNIAINITSSKNRK